MAAPGATSLAVDEAVARVTGAVAPLPAERVFLPDALGRVLARDVISPVTLPAWTNSAMDGFAARAADVRGASASRPVRLTIVETVAAGAFPSRVVGAGEATRIMTGAPVPDGADTVVRVEDTGADDGATVEIRADRDAGKNLRPRGEDLREGDVALPAGTPVGPGQIGVLAACGAALVDVHRRPRVAILGSGDELVELEHYAEALAGRRVVSTNGYTLAAAVRAAGGDPVMLGTAPDDPDALAARLADAAGCDLLITSAGVSVGAHDHTRPVLERLGATLDFWRVRMRPGAPVGFGLVRWQGGARATPWLGLPGNPVSALVTFELFARPAIRRLCGHRRLFRPPLTVALDEPVRVAARLTHFLRVRLVPRADGTMGARLTGPQGSGIVTSVALADALLVVPEGTTEVAPGARLRAIPLGDDAVATDVFAL